MKYKNTADLRCKSIFKGNSAEKRKEDFTRKMAELINAQERAKRIYTTND